MVTIDGMTSPLNSAGVDDATVRRLIALEVQVEELDRARRRALTLGPIVLLVLANVTPLVIARPRNDPDEQHTLLQLMFGAVPALPAGWFLLLGVAGLGCFGAAVAVGRSTGRPGRTRAIIAPAAILLALLVVVLVVVTAAGTRNTGYLVLTPAAALGAAAAIWLIVGALSLRR
jgi:hypothetical protein